ncbi:hypothetical protein BDK51DRAFT_34058 [Blyttiomyces helicus]|uniref:BTB domain-containing protein n=1 Tax=Blyttiomyces helicus TaxID=388810 RepID=A0A4P9W243_9FUNG|nr:hypothetical protein BDK51DRAFT_34058 [Blyttiomyces helicus]|eukprot:RKO84650.1 hypothetical protein BDK51DRAFT_34058 [Blyttiomyces helicus]
MPYCYLSSVSPTGDTDNYEVTSEQAQVLAARARFFAQLLAIGPPMLAATNAPGVPIVQVALPQPEAFDLLLHWLYHEDEGFFLEQIEASPELAEGVAANAKFLQIVPNNGIWALLESFGVAVVPPLTTYAVHNRPGKVGMLHGSDEVTNRLAFGLSSREIHPHQVHAASPRAVGGEWWLPTRRRSERELIACLREEEGWLLEAETSPLPLRTQNVSVPDSLPSPPAAQRMLGISVLRPMPSIPDRKGSVITLCIMANSSSAVRDSVVAIYDTKLPVLDQTQ